MMPIFLLDVMIVMRKILLCCALVTLTGCQWLANYRNFTQQGNRLLTDRVAQLRIGMSKGEVANIIGMPVYDNTFRDDRWSYVHTSQARSRHVNVKKLILSFKHNKLAKIQ